MEMHQENIRTCSGWCPACSAAATKCKRTEMHKSVMQCRCTMGCDNVLVRAAYDDDFSFAKNRPQPLECAACGQTQKTSVETTVSATLPLERNESRMVCRLNRCMKNMHHFHTTRDRAIKHQKRQSQRPHARPHSEDAPFRLHGR